jgi:hypothetical protein
VARQQVRPDDRTRLGTDPQIVGNLREKLMPKVPTIMAIIVGAWKGDFEPEIGVQQDPLLDRSSQFSLVDRDPKLRI